MEHILYDISLNKNGQNGEDDLSTLKEILTNHDLDQDKPARTFEEFTKKKFR